MIQPGLGRGLTATYKIGDAPGAEKATPASPFNAEKATPASPFDDAEKATPATRKGDTSDKKRRHQRQEKATRVSPPLRKISKKEEVQEGRKSLSLTLDAREIPPPLVPRKARKRRAAKGSSPKRSISSGPPIAEATSNDR